MTINQSAFLDLVRVGIGTKSTDQIRFDAQIDWSEIQDLAGKHGLSAIAMDGLKVLPLENKPQKNDLIRWIGGVLQGESIFAKQQEVAAEMALLFKRNYVRTYVLKGAVVSDCYPKPEHRLSVDMDCYLLPEKGNFDAWALGNDLVRSNGFEVSTDFYKNSTFYLPGLTVENHQFLTPFRGNKQLKSLEVTLQAMIKDDMQESDNAENRKFECTWLYHPPVMVTALFLIEHAYSHFLHEGLTWRHILDWMMFTRKHKSEIEWDALNTSIDKFGFRKFFDSYEHLGRFLLGEIDEEDLSRKDRRMLEDVWDELHVTESYHGVKAKVSFAFNTIRSWWKYHYFSEISMPHALLIQVWGFLFLKHPSLN